MEPWGTPQVTSLISDILPSNKTKQIYWLNNIQTIKIHFYKLHNGIIFVGFCD